MPGSQVKDWDTYHALRGKGKSKSQAARIANAISSERKRRRVVKGSPDVGDVHVASAPQPRRRKRRRRRSQDLLTSAMLTKHGNHDQSTHGNWARGIARLSETFDTVYATQQGVVPGSLDNRDDSYFDQPDAGIGSEGSNVFGQFYEVPNRVASEFRIDHIFPDQLQENDVILSGREMRGRPDTAFRYLSTVRHDPETGDRWILGDEPDRKNVVRVVNDSGSPLDIIRIPDQFRAQFMRKHAGPGPHPSGSDQSVHGRAAPFQSVEPLLTTDKSATGRRIQVLRRSGESVTFRVISEGGPQLAVEYIEGTGPSPIDYESWHRDFDISTAIYLDPDSVAKHYGPGPHANGSPQSIHGNWSRDTSAPDILEDTESEGGTTKELTTGTLPKRGFAVALHELGQSFSAEKISPRSIQTFIRTRYAQLTQPGRFLGTWLDKDSGQVWLDVVQVFDNSDYSMAFEQAVAFGKSEEELAVFDLANFEEVRLTPRDIRAYGKKLKLA